MEENNSVVVWKDFKLEPLPNFNSSEYEVLNYQNFSVYKALTTTRFVVGLPTGTGKTLVSYLIYEYYKQRYPNLKLIILTNASSTIQFENEYNKFFTTRLKSVSIHKDMYRFGGKNYKEARDKVYQMFCSRNPHESLDFFVSNYSTFERDFTKIYKAVQEAKRNGFKVMFVADEATRFKELSTSTSKCATRLNNLLDKSVELTATLTKGKLEESYGIFKAIGINISATKKQFEDEFCIIWRHPKKWYITNITGYKNVAEFVNRIKDYSIILRKRDVAPFLPPFTIIKTYLDHSPEQVRIIDSIYTGMVNVNQLNPDYNEEEAQLEDMIAIESLTAVGYVQRALLDYRLVTEKNSNVDLKIKSPKTEEIIRLLTEDFTDEKVVIYTSSKRYLEILYKTIKKEKSIPDFYKKEIGIISGDVRLIDREDYKERFTNTNEINLMLIDDAGAEAINLQAASNMIICNIPKSGGDLVQLVGRIRRLNSKHSNLYINYLMMKDSQDEDEYLICNQQIQLISAVQGEQETGLLDWKLLRELESKGRSELISESELQSKSMAKLVLRKRKKKADYYRDLLEKIEEKD